MVDIKYLSYADIKRATRNFDDALKFGKWKFGNFYKVYLDNTEVAVKVLSNEFYLSKDDFLDELKVLKQLSHPNLGKIVGACVEPPILVYEIPPQITLKEYLHNNPQILTWRIRARIVSQLCSALLLLYSKKPHPIIHGYISTNLIFIDQHLNIKVMIPEGTDFTNPHPRGKFTEHIETGNQVLNSDVISLGDTIREIFTVNAHNVILGSPTSRLINKLSYFCSKFDGAMNSFYSVTNIISDLKTILALTSDFTLDEDAVSIAPSSSSSMLHNVKHDEVKISSDSKDRSSSHKTIYSWYETTRIKTLTVKEIHAATDGLSESSKIGNGGYGSVYKGQLDSLDVAIKVLDTNKSQGSTEFLKEIDVLGEIHHTNLVRLVGVCFKLRSLVYEFVSNGSLEDCLKERPQDLTWQIRTRIIFQICSVLRFLHAQQPQPVVHGDLKPQNVLLDSNFTVKLTDFGLCRFLPEGAASPTVAFHVTENIKGTLWYIDPDYLVSGKLTPGCDVYAFGITIMRALTGLPAINLRKIVKSAFKRETLMEIVDTKAGNWPNEMVTLLTTISLSCTAPNRMCSTLMEKASEGLQNYMAKYEIMC